jgi:hypothetical protein
MIVFQQLPHLRPSCFYIFGSLSFLTLDPEVIKDKLDNTGTGVGGSGGVKEGRVSQVMVQGAGHLIPMEKVEESATHVATWVGQELARWRANEKLTDEEWGNMKGVERSMMPPRFQEEIRNMKEGKYQKEKEAKL